MGLFMGLQVYSVDVYPSICACTILSPFLKKLFIYFRMPWVFVAACKLSLVVASGGYFLVAVHGHLIVVASLVAEHGL